MLIYLAAIGPPIDFGKLSAWITELDKKCNEFSYNYCGINFAKLRSILEAARSVADRAAAERQAAGPDPAAAQSGPSAESGKKKRPRDGSNATGPRKRPNPEATETAVPGGGLPPAGGDPGREAPSGPVGPAAASGGAAWRLGGGCAAGSLAPAWPAGAAGAAWGCLGAGSGTPWPGPALLCAVPRPPMGGWLPAGATTLRLGGGGGGGGAAWGSVFGPLGAGASPSLRPRARAAG